MIVIAVLLASPAFTATAPDTVKTKTPVSVSTYQGTKNMTANDKEYYEKAVKEKGMTQTGSGLLYKSLKEGNGASPNVLDYVTVNFRGTLSDGKEFNSSYKHQMPAVHRMNRVFRCWQEGLLKMKVGGKAKFVCPSELAFKGNGSAGVVPPGSLVIYEIELLKVKK